jgi:iron uptake system component EfeO
MIDRLRGARMLTALLVTATVATGCSDDGAAVRELGASGGSASTSGSAAGSGSTAASGSTAGSGSLAEQDLGATTSDALVMSGVRDYKGYLTRQVDALIAKTTTFTDAVRAGDLDAARAAYAPSRVPWERVEPVAGLVAAIDGAVDARVDDFADTDDPDFTGWHRLEYLLFERGTTAGAATFADRLDADLQRLRRGLPDLTIPPAAVPVGAAELVEEVSLGKITGEENRYAKTPTSTAPRQRSMPSHQHSARRTPPC